MSATEYVRLERRDDGRGRHHRMSHRQPRRVPVCQTREREAGGAFRSSLRTCRHAPRTCRKRRNKCATRAVMIGASSPELSHTVSLGVDTARRPRSLRRRLLVCKSFVDNNIAELLSGDVSGMRRAFPDRAVIGMGCVILLMTGWKNG